MDILHILLIVVLTDPNLPEMKKCKDDDESE
jgi:hypothetical protein